MNKGFSAGVLVSLAGLATIANAFGQAWKSTPNEPLEKYDMPPAYIYRLDTSPRMISPHGAFTSYQVNVDAAGNNIVGDAANEPCITMDLSRLRGRAPRHASGRDLVVAMTLCRRPGMWLLLDRAR